MDTNLKSLQCSGRTPCEHCVRRQKHCELPARDLAIKLDHESSNHSTGIRNGPRNTLLSQKPSLDKQLLYVSGFFRIFLAKNSFSGRPSSYRLDVQGCLTSLDSLLNIVSAIGALQARGMSRSLQGHQAVDALHYYRAAVVSLQAEILQSGSQSWLRLAWSIFFMGVFEVRPSSLLRHVLKTHSLFGHSEEADCLLIPALAHI